MVCSPLKKQAFRNTVEREMKVTKSAKQESWKGIVQCLEERERERERERGEYDENLLLMQSRREALEKEVAFIMLFFYKMEEKKGTWERNNKRKGIQMEIGGGMWMCIVLY